MSSRAKAFLLFAVLVALLIWAPWISKRFAERRVIQAFSAAWEGVIDGCGFSCQGCGVKNSRPILAGYAVEIEYACGAIPADTPEFHLSDRVWVSFLGSVYGLPEP